MKLLKRDIGVIPYAANQQATLQLPRNYAYRALSLRLECNLDWTETTAGVVLDSAPCQLVRNIMVRANGRDVIKNVPMDMTHRFNQFQRGCRPHILSPANTTAATNQDLYAHCVIPFEMWRAVRPIDTLYDSSGLATNELIVDWGVGADIFGGAYGGTVTVNEANLYVSSIEAIGVPEGTKFSTHKEYTIESVITAASTRHQITLPVSNVYRAFLIRTVSDDVCVDTILNNIILRSGTEVFINKNDFHVQMDNRIDYQMENPVSLAAALGGHEYGNLRRCGYYLVDFVRDGRLTECLNTGRLSSLDFILDVNHPGTTDVITIIPVELITPPEDRTT